MILATALFGRLLRSDVIAEEDACWVLHVDVEFVDDRSCNIWGIGFDTFRVVRTGWVFSSPHFVVAVLSADVDDPGLTTGMSRAVADVNPTKECKLGWGVYYWGRRDAWSPQLYV